MWGCFYARRYSKSADDVFPTHVGVFPIYGGIETSRFRLPHACGGVSLVYLVRRDLKRSSPRMWGCFWDGWTWRIPKGVFPTHVGVFPDWKGFTMPISGLPHACGGVSVAFVGRDGAIPSSPRMWGCFRNDESDLPDKFGLPHACGGVSNISGWYPSADESSPRMWGCFSELVE